LKALEQPHLKIYPEQRYCVKKLQLEGLRL
jgi:hypothetical protein